MVLEALTTKKEEDPEHIKEKGKEKTVGRKNNRTVLIEYMQSLVAFKDTLVKLNLLPE